jgi:hypothetical protein
MKINFLPQRRDDTLEMSRAGAVLTLNGEAFDFSPLADGDTIPASAINSPWFVGQVANVGGELELTLFLPLPAHYSQAQAFPEALVLTADGPVSLPQPLPVPEASQEPEA